MAVCLLGLGSNLGDSAVTLRDAVAWLRAVEGLQVERCSDWYCSPAAGGPANQSDYLNGVVLAETALPPTELLTRLHLIEADLGRQRRQRWAARTLDIDLLLYGQQVINTPTLALPHPRMSFRPFVIEPAARIAGHLVHPVLGWTIAQLQDHLNSAADVAAILAPDTRQRTELATMVAEQFGGQVFDPPTPAPAALWPPQSTSWVRFDPEPGRTQPSTDLRPQADPPKLSIVFGSGSSADWASTVALQGRGPTLVLPEEGPAEIAAEALAAVSSVWPDLGPVNAGGIEYKAAEAFHSPHGN